MAQLISDFVVLLLTLIATLWLSFATFVFFILCAKFFDVFPAPPPND